MTKTLTFLFLLVFSAPAFAKQYFPLGTDFAPFPLSTSNVALIEGVWRGEAIDIKIDDSGYTFGDKPILWVELKDHEQGSSRSGVIYYSKTDERYKLMTTSSREIIPKAIPVSLGVFEFTEAYAADAGMSCRSGGALLKIEFKLSSVVGEVLLTKESCP